MNEDIQIKYKEKSEIEISGSVKPEIYDTFRPRAIKKLGANMDMPGFRKGHVPEGLLVQKLGEQRIMEEVANMALAEIYPRIIASKKLDVVGQPSVGITKLAKGNPIEFTIKTAILPKAKLPDYMALAEDSPSIKEDIEASPADVEDVINRIRKEKAKETRRKLNPEAKITDGDIKEADLPALTDEFVKSLGEFSDVNDFKIKLTKNVKRDKEIRARDKRRALILDSIVSKTDLVLPQIVVDAELSKMLAGFKDNVAKVNLSFDDYLKQIGKTEEDMKQAWHADAQKRAKTQIVLNEIAKRENIKPKKEDVDKEVAHLLKHHDKADPRSAEVYVTSVLANHMVLELLEGVRGKQVDTN